jgi:hypothetical protein
MCSTFHVLCEIMRSIKFDDSKPVFAIDDGGELELDPDVAFHVAARVTALVIMLHRKDAKLRKVAQGVDKMVKELGSTMQTTVSRAVSLMTLGECIPASIPTFSHVDKSTKERCESIVSILFDANKSIKPDAPPPNILKECLKTSLEVVRMLKLHEKLREEDLYFRKLTLEKAGVSLEDRRLFFSDILEPELLK